MPNDLKSLYSHTLEQLNHAKQGLDYYATLVETLSDNLAGLEKLGIVSGSTETAPVKATTGERPQKTRPYTKKKISTAKAAATNPAASSQHQTDAGELPHTGIDFWLKHMPSKDNAIARKDFIQACVNDIGFKLNPDQLRKLTSRAAFALTDLSRKKKISKTADKRYHLA